MTPDVPAGRFAGRRALVTGASRGIGAAVAERLAAEGAAVALTARTLDADDRLGGGLAVTAERLARYRVPVATVVADLTDDTDRERIVPEAAEALGGPVDVLVNNAAAAIYQTLAEIPTRRRRLMFEANVHAPLDLAQAVIPGMRAAGEGWIVNVSSRVAQPWDGPPFALGAHGTTIAAYGASKAALNRLTNGLAAELYGTGIRVNTVEPRAAVHTEGADELVGGSVPADKFELLEAMVEAVVALCACPADMTGRRTVSLDLIAEWGLAVHGLDGRPLAP
ncbi:MAG TPA: SDR family NAD(P)-dependent oxidoreductase [Acidimicrobiales bacterium]|nr:SDR family NAD(P)-dependent oxidoreductase [Acidimicrobiales bacterium]